MNRSLLIALVAFGGCAKDLSFLYQAPIDGLEPVLHLGEIPVIEVMELTTDIAKRALDSYLLVRTKYENADLESYENLQDFVDQNPEGQAFEADIKAAGFANVNDWNLAITTLGFAYTGVVDDQSADIQQQISELEADPELARDMKDRMIASLKAMIPSENNRKVVEELLGRHRQVDLTSPWASEAFQGCSVFRLLVGAKLDRAFGGEVRPEQLEHVAGQGLGVGAAAVP